MHRKGFSLIEVLICLTLTFILILGAGQLIIHSLVSKKSAEANIQVATLASSTLEYLKSFPFDSEEIQEGKRSELLQEEGKISIRRDLSIEDVSHGMKRIEVHISTQGIPPKKSHIILYLSRDLGFHP